MYKIIIKTTYNTITLLTQNIDEYKEVYEQPYVESVEVVDLVSLDDLVKERENLLNKKGRISHLNQIILALDTEIEEKKDGRKRLP